MDLVIYYLQEWVKKANLTINGKQKLLMNFMEPYILLY